MKSFENTVFQEQSFPFLIGANSYAGSSTEGTIVDISNRRGFQNVRGEIVLKIDILNDAFKPGKFEICRGKDQFTLDHFEFFKFCEFYGLDPQFAIDLININRESQGHNMGHTVLIIARPTIEIQDQKQARGTRSSFE